MAQRSDLIFTIPDCPRCGCDHQNLEFSRMVSPVFVGTDPTVSVGMHLDLCATCPAKAEPILGRIYPTGEVEVR